MRFMQTNRRNKKTAPADDQHFITSDKVVTGYLLGIQRPGVTAREAAEHLEELEQLTITYGVPVAGKEIAVVRDPNPAYLTGSGKVEQIRVACEAVGAGVIIIDDDLTPSQQRNWEEATGLAVIDRREVILGIFADRAQTREARLQVQLARAEYSLPRLTRAWTHLERQRGGGGLRGGAGEAQLEVDRRLVREQISKLKRELEHVRRVRATERKTRTKVPVPTAVLVGYTNAGKSSLLNALTGAKVLEEDKLFATLDPTTRKLPLPNGQLALISDTVGFVRKLPHTLVEAFKATLEEAQLANMLIHVVDASHVDALAQRTATETVLAELKAIDKPTILALNKVDRLPERFGLESLRRGYDYVVETSTVTGEGLEKLRDLITELAGHDIAEVMLRVPPDKYDVVSQLHELGQVVSTEHDDDITVIIARVPEKLMPRFERYVVKRY